MSQDLQTIKHAYSTEECHFFQSSFTVSMIYWRKYLHRVIDIINIIYGSPNSI